MAPVGTAYYVVAVQVGADSGRHSLFALITVHEAWDLALTVHFHNQILEGAQPDHRTVKLQHAFHVAFPNILYSPSIRLIIPLSCRCCFPLNCGALRERPPAYNSG